MVGRAGAGKTTLARRLGQELRAPVFCEDAWLSKISDPITSVEDYLKATARLRAAIGPQVIELLRLGVDVVLDFSANTPRQRQWVRSIFEAASADHVLHFLDADEAACRARVHERNVTQPAGIFFGVVTDALLDEVNPYFVAPSAEEDFRVRKAGSGG
jgi:predicted kinase